MCEKAGKSSLGWYVKNNIEPLIVALKISNTVPVKTPHNQSNFNQQDNEEKLNNWRGKAVYGQYVRQIEDKGKSNT